MKNPKNLVIVGSGTAGAMLANKMAKSSDVTVTVIDDQEWHYYQPGFLFIPFNKLNPTKIKKLTAKVLNSEVSLVKSQVSSIDRDVKKVKANNGEEFSYDVLVIATGTHGDASLTDGLDDEQGWYKTIFDFYSPGGAIALKNALQAFTGGRLVVQIAEMPIKCPVAPLEFAFLADDYLKKRKLRHKTDITFVTPLSGAFTKPVCSQKLGYLLEQKNINLQTDFFTEKIDANNKIIKCYDGREIAYDLLVTVPTNVGAKIMQGQDFTDDMGFVEVDQHTLQSVKDPNIFAIGDATNVATSKAGSVAHFEADVLMKNILDYLHGMPLSEQFDGHSNCFVELGGGKGLLLDFNYQTEPLEGKFPFALVGPMSLLKPSRINHIGKLMFRYIYWTLLIPGRKIPFIPNKMSLKGKKINNN